MGVRSYGKATTMARIKTKDCASALERQKDKVENDVSGESCEKNGYNDYNSHGNKATLHRMNKTTSPCLRLQYSILTSMQAARFARRCVSFVLSRWVLVLNATRCRFVRGKSLRPQCELS